MNPLNKVSGPAFDRTGANRTFLQNVFAFRQLNHLPRPLAFAEDITVKNFIQNKAQWDKSCQKDFSKYHLEREQRKKDVEEAGQSSEPSQKRQQTSSPLPKNVCSFVQEQKDIYMKSAH